MIPYLQVENLTKSFGDLVLFHEISFGIAQGQRIGLIAKNGSGKTTLLNILAGKEGYDEGNITFRRDLRVGYLEQSPSYPEGLIPPRNEVLPMIMDPVLLTTQEATPTFIQHASLFISFIHTKPEIFARVVSRHYGFWMLK